jgi:hypothetical protein
MKNNFDFHIFLIILLNMTTTESLIFPITAAYTHKGQIIAILKRGLWFHVRLNGGLWCDPETMTYGWGTEISARKAVESVIERGVAA